MGYSATSKSVKLKSMKKFMAGSDNHDYYDDVFRYFENLKSPPNYGKFEDYLKIELEYLDTTDQLKADFTIINTPGPILGFMGFFIDTASGYILCSTTKTKEYVPVINLYNYLEKEFDVNVSPNLMTSLIERFKMADKVDGTEMTLSHVVRELNQAGVSSSGGGSVISRIISKDAVTSSGTLEVKDLIEFYKFVNKYISTFGRLVSNNTRTYKSEKLNLARAYVAEADTSLLKLFDEAKAAGILSVDNNRIFRAVEDYIGDRADGEEASNHLYRGMSSMVHSHYYTNANFSTGTHSGRNRDITFEELNKTETRLINMYDILEEREDESLLEFDNIILSEAASVDKRDIRKVQEKIGVKEYLSGATLAHLSKGMKYGEGTVKELIDDLYKDIENLTDNSVSLLTDRYSIGIKKSGRFIGRILKMIDSAIR